jgi:putative two-component system response regulator
MTTKTRDTNHIWQILRGGSWPAGADLRITLELLERESKHRLRESSSPETRSFFEAVVRALSRIKVGSNLESRLSCLHTAACFAYDNKSVELALKSSRLLSQLATRSDSALWKRRAAMIAGVFHADMGNIAEAIVHYAEALEIARTADDIGAEAGVLGNLGACLTYGGLYRDAIPVLQRAHSIASTCRDQAPNNIGEEPHQRERMALTNLAAALQCANDKRQALRVLSQALSLPVNTTHPHAVTALLIRESNYVRLAVDLGMIGEARIHAMKCHQYRNVSGSRGRNLVDFALSLCDFYDGDTARGLVGLEKALEEAEGTAVKADILCELARALDSLGQSARALSYIDRLLAALHETRKRAVSALLSANLAEAEDQLSSETEDLQLLRFTQAEYRARTAEQTAEKSCLETLERLAIAADLKDDASGGHGYRVGRLASQFAASLHWTKDQCHYLDLAGRLHDIGKLALPDRLILKDETLRDAERQYLSAHTKVGAELLAQAPGVPVVIAQEVARFHHERWDGSGYPYGLAGERIPIAARITALADTFDVMTHEQPYSSALSPEDALREISNCMGTQFDPTLGRLFISFAEKICEAHPDLDRFLGVSAQSSAFTEARRRIETLLQENSIGESAAAE